MLEPTVAVVVAYRDPGCPYRRLAWDALGPFYDDLAWELGAALIVADSEPFTKARALNEAIGRLPADTVVVQADPDSFLTDPGDSGFPDRYWQAIDEAVAAPGLVVPHSRFVYLTEQASAEWIEWLTTSRRFAPTASQVEETGCGVGNTTVFTRDTWELAGGYDERFPLWAGDDAAFAYACGALAAPLRRLDGDVLHLWHPRPPESTPGHDGYTQQMEILEQYRDAADTPSRMRDLVAGR